MSILAIVFNYNLPDVATAIYDKLRSDGFTEDQVIVVDNGSDKNPVPLCANFRLPWNVRFTGQSYMALHFALKFSKFEDFLLITTSAELHPEINYKKAFEQSRSMARRFGFIASALLGGLTDSNCPLQRYEGGKQNLVEVYEYQPIVTLVSRRLLEFCLEKDASYFNLALVRGWGIDRELQYIANANGLRCFIDKGIPTTWVTNQAHRRGVADESAESYHNKALVEMEAVFSERYGNQWRRTFAAAFDAEQKFDRPPSFIEKAKRYIRTKRK